MYLYNIKNQLRTIRREEIKNILYDLDNDFREKATSLGSEGLIIKPFPENNAIIVYEEQKWFDRSFDNPNKDVVSGLILYYTLVGNDICTYNAFTCNIKEFDIENGCFGQIKHLGIIEDSHFKRIKVFTEKIRLLYPDMLTVGDDVFYKNQYLLLNSYPADKKKRFEVAEEIKTVDGVSACKYHKNEPFVSFDYKNCHFLLVIRKDCILYKGIIYPYTNDFLDALNAEFPIKIENILTDNKQNTNFIEFVKNPDNISIEDFIFKEQSREMDEERARTGDLIF